MSIYLNSDKPLINYKKLINGKYFVDKSLIIEKINDVIDTKDCYLCITRPRRFGKSSVADMLGAYYSKARNSKEIFDNLKISNCHSYDKNLNKYNVIYINFNRLSDRGNSYTDYIERIKSNIRTDIAEKYSNVDVNKYFSISDMLESLNDKFIFIFDEWDYIFSNNLYEENQNDYLEFLRDILKDQPYVALAYMTGVLPIKRYSSGSALNMFDEFTMLNDMIYGEYFGFTESEVKDIQSKQLKISLNDIKSWYNGYINEEGMEIYNPRSVVKALQNGKCKSYWTNTGAMDEVAEYLKYNILEIREDVIEMVSGEEVSIYIDEEFRAGQKPPRTKEEIYSAMIILGFLAYHNGYLKIPNQELMREFEKALKDQAFGEVAEIIDNSKKILKATINKDEKAVVKLIHDIHNSEIPILQCEKMKSNSLHSLDKFSKPNQRFGSSLENSLSCVITLAYLSARDFYKIEREEKTGKGYADFTFHPKRKSDIAFIVELKKNESAEKAIEQIKNKEYIQKFKKENNKVLAVAICYDFKNKEHSCKIEELN